MTAPISETLPPTRGRIAVIQAIRGVSLCEYLWLIASLLFSFALRVPFFRVAMIADEGGYAYATRGWLDGTGKLYQDLWISRPQGIFIVYAAIFETLGTGTVAFRLASWIACALTTIVVWMIARQWTSRGVALFAAGCFAFFSSLPNIEGFTANAEIFMGLPAAITAWLLLRSWQLGWGKWHLLSIGIMTGLAIQLKPAGIVMMPIAAVFILLIEPTPLVVVLKRVGWMSLGLAIIGVPSLIHGWYLGWDDFIFATVEYRLTSQSSVTTTLQGHVDGILKLLDRIFGLAISLLVILILKYRDPIRRGYLKCAFSPHPHVPKLKRTPRALNLVPPATVPIVSLSRPSDPAGFLIRVWVIGCLAGIAMGGDWWPHYLLQLAAPFAIWFAKTTVDLWRSLPKPDRRMFLVVMIGLQLTPYWVLGTGDYSWRSITNSLFDHAGYPAQQDVADYIREHTEPGTKIFVAFDQAAIYYLADRPPSYRHLYEQELNAIPNSYSEILSMIQSADRPMYIVTTRQADVFPDRGAIFWQLVGEYYQLETEIDGVPIYRRKE
jgi:4-amino-4-deoxy-L-arabinose transferase-like glycosyltransferase